MDLGLKNKVAFVAGASRGIGNAIASAFLREGSRTVITGRTPEKLEQARTTLAKQWGEDYVLAIAGDLTAPDTIKNAFRETIARWGNIDCVVANIGSGKSTPGWDLSDKDWSMALEQNFWPGIRIAQQAAASRNDGDPTGQTEQGMHTVLFKKPVSGRHLRSSMRRLQTKPDRKKGIPRCPLFLQLFRNGSVVLQRGCNQAPALAESAGDFPRSRREREYYRVPRN